VAALSITLCGLASPALAQSDDRESSTGYTAILDNIDLLVDNYARFLARKYDLTEEQDDYTKYLLRERSYEFLDKHEGELRGTIDRLFDVRTGGEMTPEELIEWGQRVKPVYEEAKKLIVDGNDEWREILTPEQKKIHDQDVKLMYQSFETTEDQLGRILTGEMTVEEFRSPKQKRRTSSTKTKPRPSRDEPPLTNDMANNRPPPPEPGEPRRISPRDPRDPTRAVREAGGDVVRPAGERRPTKTAERRREGREPAAEPRSARTSSARPKPRVTNATSQKGFESQWEKYVREFVAKYKLNDEQTQKANAVLDDCKEQANRYLQGRKGQIELYDRQLETLKKSKDKNKSKKTAELTTKRKKLMEPIDQIFEKQLKPRLERLPTRAQRRQAEAAAKKPGTKGKPPKQSPKKPSRGDDE
jgi:hypothetical protein